MRGDLDNWVISGLTGLVIHCLLLSIATHFPHNVLLDSVKLISEYKNQPLFKWQSVLYSLAPQEYLPTSPFPKHATSQNLFELDFFLFKSVLHVILSFQCNFPGWWLCKWCWSDENLSDSRMLAYHQTANQSSKMYNTQQTGNLAGTRFISKVVPSSEFACWD